MIHSFLSRAHDMYKKRRFYYGKFDEKWLSHGNRGAIRKLRHRGKGRHAKNYEEKRVLL